MFARVLLLTTSLFVTSAALAATPEARYEGASTTGTTPSYESASTASQLADSGHQWSMIIDLHGRGTQAGVGLGGETPEFWDTLSARAAFSYDQIKNSATDTQEDRSIDLAYAQIGLKATGPRVSSIGIYNGLVLNFNFYFPRDGTTRGRRFGSELCYEVEWRQRYEDGWTGRPRNFSAFINMGLADSDMRVTNGYGNEQIGNGFVSRLGLRRFF